MKIKILLLSIMLVTSVTVNAHWAAEIIGFFARSATKHSDNVIIKGKGSDFSGFSSKVVDDPISQFDGAVFSKINPPSEDSVYSFVPRIFGRAFYRMSEKECNKFKRIYSLSEERRVVENVLHDALQGSSEANLVLGDIKMFYNSSQSCFDSKAVLSMKRAALFNIPAVVKRAALFKVPAVVYLYEKAYFDGDLNPIASYKLARYYLDSGNTEEASKWLRRFKERESNYESAKLAYSTYKSKFYSDLIGKSDEKNFSKSKFNIGNPSFMNQE